jgi:hypothetical protein
LFYNPNIEPVQEYEKRKREVEKLAVRLSLHSLRAIQYHEYNNKAFKAATMSLDNEPEGGERCASCYELRLRETAARVVKEGYDIFATTLTVSPHKDASVINEIGLKLADEYKVRYLQSDFKKQGGYMRSVELSKEFGLYRQKYCGCLLSKR